MYQNNYGYGTQQQQMSQYAYVSGLEGAKAYQMMPNSTMMLMDSDAPVFYLKQTNAMGQATIRSFRFEEVKTEPEKQITQGEFQKLSEQVQEIMNMMKRWEEPAHESNS